jgi:hypothetical protein
MLNIECLIHTLNLRKRCQHGNKTWRRSFSANSTSVYLTRFLGQRPSNRSGPPSSLFHFQSNTKTTQQLFTTENKSRKNEGEKTARQRWERRQNRKTTESRSTPQNAYRVRMSSSFLDTSVTVLLNSSAIDFCFAGSSMLYCSQRSPSIQLWGKNRRKRGTNWSERNFQWKQQNKSRDAISDSSPWQESNTTGRRCGPFRTREGSPLACASPGVGKSRSLLDSWRERGRRLSRWS